MFFLNHNYSFRKNRYILDSVIYFVVNSSFCCLPLQVSDIDTLSGGIVRLQVAEAEVNNISIRFLDRKT